VDLGAYRLFLVAVVAALAFVLALAVRCTRFGTQVRAAVDDARVARGMGIDVDRVFCVTFAIGSGLAGLGGALGIDVLGLDPSFPLKFMAYFLLVVVAAALVLGVLDSAGKYYVPQAAAFVIDAAMVAMLVAFPGGLFARRR
jgi:branched-chain amino acid transport system permease protein